MKRKLKDDDRYGEERNASYSDSEANSVGSDDEASEFAASPKTGTVVSMTKEPILKQPKLSKGDLYKPPTNEEISQLKETENLFHSSLFRMQISELMSEVSLKTKRCQDIDLAIDCLTEKLKSMKEDARYELQDCSWLKKSGIKTPFTCGPMKTKGSFQFKPPTEVQVSGSYLLGTCIKPNPIVDVTLVMPKAFFEARDFLNMRYLRKCALYLCSVARNLKHDSKIESMKFTYHHGNHLKPVLLLAVRVSEHRKVQLCLHVVPEEGVFKLNRFHLQKNNVRAHWFHGQEEDEEPADQVEGVPTPFYNSTVLADLTQLSTEKVLQEVLSSSQGVKEGIVLLKVWLRQRGLNVGFGGFSDFIMTMYVCYLLKKRKLNSFMSSFQILRNTLLNLSKSDWAETGLSLCTGRKGSDENVPSMLDFFKHFDVVFVDPSGFYNFCFMMNRTMLERVCGEAHLAVGILENKHVDSFDKLFMRKIPFASKFDHMFSFSLCTEDVLAVLEKLDLGHSVVNFGIPSIHLCTRVLVPLLKRALGKRIHLLQSMTQKPEEWFVDKTPQLSTGEKTTFGLLLNPEYAFTVLDRGPSPNSEEGDEFRQFWGEKSELRRFQDGGICEAVLWFDNANIAEKQLVCSHIVQYILNRHAAIDMDSIHYYGGQLDKILQLPVAPLVDQLPYGNGEEQNLQVIGVYDNLCKMLRKLKDLPLVINTIQGTSPCFRFTEVFPPMPCNFRHRENGNLTHGVKRYVPSTDKACPHYVQTLKVVCTLEGSGKWPEDIAAMKRLKVAFLIQLAEAMKSTFNVPVKVHTGHVDVLKDNYVFRLVIAYSREIALLKTSKAADGKLLKQDTEEALALEKQTVVLPRLTSTLHGLHQQYPSFSTTVRLAKRWVCAHMLGDHIDPIAVEILVASLYLHPEPNVPPSSGLCGFQRFLELLSTFDWKTFPLMVNLNNEFTDEDYLEIPARFTKERSTLPLMFISTPLDKFSNHWTKHQPSSAILTRLVLLAIHSLETVHNLLHKEESPDFKQVFRPSLSMFDILIHLNQQQLPRKHEALDLPAGFKKLSYDKPIDEERFPVLDFDPPRLLLKELEMSFGDVALFFHDEHGGSVIGMLWKPQVLQPQEFKVSHINYSKLHTLGSQSDIDVQIVPNLEAIVEDIAILGRGLICKIEILKDLTNK